MRNSNEILDGGAFVSQQDRVQFVDGRIIPATNAKNGFTISLRLCMLTKETNKRINGEQKLHITIPLL